MYFKHSDISGLSQIIQEIEKIDNLQMWIEETSKSGTGVAKIRGFVVLVNNSNPGERVKIRIKQVSRNHEWLMSFSNSITN